MTYFNNCNNQNTDATLISSVFGEVTTLFAEAVESYRYGHFEAAMTMLRSSIDALFFSLGERKLKWTDKEKGLFSLEPAMPIEWWESAKPSHTDSKMREHSQSIPERGYLSGIEFNKLKKLREKGNFSAHFFARRTKELAKLINDLKNTRSTDLRQKAVQNMKYYTSDEEANAAITEAMNLILKVEAAHTSYLMKTL